MKSVFPACALLLAALSVCAAAKDFSELDPNYKDRKPDSDGLVWCDAFAAPVVLEGAPFRNADGSRTRFPIDLCDKVECAENYRVMSRQGAGMSIRFRAQVRKLSFRATYGEAFINRKSPAMSMGFDIYRNGRFMCNAQPELSLADGEKFVFSGGWCSGRLDDYQVYFPLQSSIVKLEIGTDSEGVVEAPTPHEGGARPIVLYGSSIANAGCVSRSGLEQSNVIGRLLQMPTVNMGFSGSARGDPAAAEAAAAADPAALVIEYEANAPSAEHLQRSFPAFFKRFRELRPNTPVILSGNPFRSYWGTKGTETVVRTWLEAVGGGDRHVEFIDWRSCFEGEEKLDLSADGEHQNDIGAHLMSRTIVSRLRPMLKE